LAGNGVEREPVVHVGSARRRADFLEVALRAAAGKTDQRREHGQALSPYGAILVPLQRSSHQILRFRNSARAPTAAPVRVAGMRFKTVAAVRRPLDADDR